MNLTLEETPRRPDPVKPTFSSNEDADAITVYRQELDGYYTQMREFNGWLSYEVLQALSAMSARASELRGHLMRNDSRRATGFRTKELDPFLDAVEFQFKVHSRLIAVQQAEWEMSKGAF